MKLYATDPHIRLFGRTYTRPEAPDHVFIPWTCAGFTVTFDGTALAAEMASDGWDKPNNRPYITVIVDGDDAHRQVLAIDREGLR